MRRVSISTLTTAIGRFLVALLFGGALVMCPNSFGQAPQSNAHCVEIGGTVMTNFTSQTSTLGTVTGDLKGAVTATILSVTPGPGNATTFNVHHQWVTEAGEMLMFEPATAVAVPTNVPGVFGVTYDEVRIVGGTGKYDGSHGAVSVFGAVDLLHGRTVFRYQGEICFQLERH
jgi:hypothetical protein